VITVVVCFLFAPLPAFAQQSFRDYRAKSIEVEAKGTVSSLARGIKYTFETEKKLCPSTRKPVPLDLKVLTKGPYTAKPDDWSDPAWYCALGPPDVQKQYFQYEIVVNAKEKKFDVIARGYPAANDKLVTIKRAGKVVGDTIELAEIERKAE
jgi:hypothetical protein